MSLRVVLALITLLGVCLRLLSWPQVFVPEGVRFFGNDAYYHLLRIQRILQHYPGVPWTDAFMNYPDGAAIPWPPLFDVSLATVAMGIGWGSPSPGTVERLCALAPVVLGALTLLVAYSLGSALLGREVGVAATLIVAVLPAHALFSRVGRLDHHVVEVLLFTLLLLAFVRGGLMGGSRLEGALADAALGLCVAAAFWSWPGSGLHLLFVVAFTGLWYILAPAGDTSHATASRTLTRGGGLAVALLLASLAIWGSEGALARVGLVGLNLFHVILVALSAAFGGVLWLLAPRTREGPRVGRVLVVGTAAVLPLLGALVLVPGFASALGHGFSALGRGNAWYRNIREFDPLLLGGWQPLGSELSRILRLFGLGLFLMPLAGFVLVQEWRRNPPRRTAVAFVAFWGVVFAVAAIARQRFIVYLTIPLALWVSLLWSRVAAAVRHRWRGGVRGALLPATLGLVILAPTGPWYVDAITSRRDSVREDLLSTLAWLETRPATDTERPSVFAEWDYGHLIQYVARKPVLVNPFGTDLGMSAMRDFAAVFLSPDSDAAEALLRRRKIGFILLSNPVTEAHFALDFAPPGTAPAVELVADRRSGARAEILESFWGLDVTRLYFFDGMVPPGFAGEALGAYRLVYESPTDRSWNDLETKTFKVFELVSGARIEVASRVGARVTASTILRTNRGRAVNWTTTIQADDTGRATLRLPYATGLNGDVEAGPYRITDGGPIHMLTLEEGDVARGTPRSLELR